MADGGSKRRQAQGRGAQAREAILAATKELVAVNGPRATTVRDITEASGANVAAVNYYFRSKEGLLRQAMSEIVGAVNDLRLERLRAMRRDVEGALSPEQILLALIGPIAEVSLARDGGSLYLRMIFQLRINPRDPYAMETFNLNDHVAQAFIDAMGATFPEVRRDALVWRYEFARGAAIHLLSDVDPMVRRIEALGGDAVPSGLGPDAVARVIALIMGGFSAPDDLAGPSA